MELDELKDGEIFICKMNENESSYETEGDEEPQVDSDGSSSLSKDDVP